MSANDSNQLTEYGVLIRAYGPDDEPGEARHREYLVEAPDEETAKEQAVDEAKNHFTKGIIGMRDSHDILEVEDYGAAETEAQA
jgi:hypothetical protein